MPFISMIHRKFTAIVFASMAFAVTLNAKYDLRIFNFEESFPIDCSDPNNPCYSQEELVKLALTNGMEAKEKVQMGSAHEKGKIVR